ncbi:GNAT family N-acetyltransferase [Phenylobacterium sp.]|uniref:GNAT family N-acetyltransferase n=1 Tax=Phenylobacterium sp. TaxID=1871053 RepID=UPI00374D7411
MVVRPALESDASLLPDVERSAGEVFRDVPALAWIADDEVQSEEQHRVYARAGNSWVAVDEGDRPLGFLSAEPCGEELHIWELAVRRDQQGRGAGRALFEACLRYARLRDLTAITLTTFRGLPWNEELYHRWGFETLVEENTGGRLADILSDEREHGLPSEQRCAMRLVL